MATTYVPATEYAHRLGIDFGSDAIPDWLPGLSPAFLAIVDEFDATRDASGYGPASVAFAMELEPWNRRTSVVAWALLRDLLGQPGTAAMFTPEMTGELRWAKGDALWIAGATPATPETVHLILSALESLPTADLPLAAEEVARVRKVVTDGDLLARLDQLDEAIAGAFRPEDVLDPLFAERIGHILDRPIRELLQYCALKRAGRPAWPWRDWTNRLIDGRYDDVHEILAAIPAHLEEHGRFSRGEDLLRGLIFVADHSGEGWVIPVLADIAVAGGTTTPVRSRKLANAAVDALYYHKKARTVVQNLQGQVTDKVLSKRIADVLEFM